MVLSSGIATNPPLADSAPDPLDAAAIAVQAGDAEAFRMIVEQLLPAVQAFVAGRSVPGVDVEDVVQRIFVETFRNIDDYQPGTNLRAWVLTIARYQLLGETTRLRRLANYHRRYIPHAIAAAAEEATREADDLHEPRLHGLRECLAQLPEASRELLLARYRGDDSIGRIAESLGRSAVAVRKQLCLLRRRLHECIERRLAGEGLA